MAIAESLGIAPKGDLDTISFSISILGQVVSPILYQGTSRGIDFYKELEAIPFRHILHASSAFGVHGGVW